jgi:kumamolisin
VRSRPELWLKVSALGVFAALAAAPSVIVPLAHAASLTVSRRVLDDDVVPGLGRAQPLGRLPHSAYLRLAFTLVPRNRAGLDGYVDGVDDPGSPLYRRYLRGSEFAARYGRTTAEIDRLRAFLKGNGFHIDNVHSGHLVVDASATAADVERTFGIRLDTWRDLPTGRVFYGNAKPPTLPADPGFLVADIAGLTDRAVRVPAVRLGRAGGLTPTELRAVYRVAPTDEGQQSSPLERVALVEFAWFHPQDAVEFDRRFASMAPAPDVRVVDGGPDDAGADREVVAAEIETVQAMAPTAIAEVFTAENSSAGEVDAIQGVIDAGVTVAMTGWAASEEQRTRSGMRAIDLILEEGAAEGVGFYAASSPSAPEGAGDIGVEFPASDPHVTAVGAADTSGSAGLGGWRGESAVFPRPWWQARWGQIDPRERRREVPDVTARTVPGVAVYTAGRWRTAGGAGVATALVAALAAREDQYASSCNEPPLGFSGPALYRLAHEQGSVSGALPGRAPGPLDETRTQATPPCLIGRGR